MNWARGGDNRYSGGTGNNGLRKCGKEGKTSSAESIPQQDDLLRREDELLHPEELIRTRASIR